jgi:hypothetical protein
MYKEEWQVIVDTCSARLFLGGISSMDTLEYLSKMLGKGTYDKRTMGRTRSRQGSTSQNWDKVGRELMDAAELSKIDKDDCLLLVSGRTPFYSGKYEYPSHPNYRYTSDGNKSYEYTYTPAPPERHEQKGGNKTQSKVQGKATAAARVMGAAVSDNSDSPEIIKEHEPIKLNDNMQDTLIHMTRNTMHQIPIDDKDYNPDGESLDDEQYEALLALLNAREASIAADGMFKQMAHDPAEITLNENVMETFFGILKAVANNNVEVIDDRTYCPDGEAPTNEENTRLAELLRKHDSDPEHISRSVMEEAKTLLDRIINTIPKGASEKLISEMPEVFDTKSSSEERNRASA